MANDRLNPQNVDLEDILYTFTLAHIEAGYTSPAKNVPKNFRGIDKTTGTVRSPTVARNLHAQYINYINRYVLFKKVEALQTLQ